MLKVLLAITLSVITGIHSYGQTTLLQIGNIRNLTSCDHLMTYDVLDTNRKTLKPLSDSLLFQSVFQEHANERMIRIFSGNEFHRDGIDFDKFEILSHHQVESTLEDQLVKYDILAVEVSHMGRKRIYWLSYLADDYLFDNYNYPKGTLANIGILSEYSSNDTSTTTLKSNFISPGDVQMIYTDRRRFKNDIDSTINVIQLNYTMFNDGEIGILMHEKHYFNGQLIRENSE